MLEVVPRTLEVGRLVQCRKTKQTAIIINGPPDWERSDGVLWFQLQWIGAGRPFAIDNISQETYTNIYNTMDILS